MKVPQMRPSLAQTAGFLKCGRPILHRHLAKSCVIRLIGNSPQLLLRHRFEWTIRGYRLGGGNGYEMTIGQKDDVPISYLNVNDPNDWRFVVDTHQNTPVIAGLGSGFGQQKAQLLGRCLREIRLGLGRRNQQNARRKKAQAKRS